MEYFLLVFMCLNIGRIDEVIYKYFCVVLGAELAEDVYAQSTSEQ